MPKNQNKTFSPVEITDEKNKIIVGLFDSLSSMHNKQNNKNKYTLVV